MGKQPSSKITYTNINKDYKGALLYMRRRMRRHRGRKFTVHLILKIETLQLQALMPMQGLAVVRNLVKTLMKSIS